MCKWQLQLMQKLDVITTVKVLPGPRTQAVPAAGNRVFVRISCLLANNNFGGSDAGIVVYAVDGGKIVPVGAITADHPTLYLSIAEVGQLIYSRFDTETLGTVGNASTLGIADGRLTDELP